MTEMSDNKPDWSQKCWRDMLVYQRKAMWHQDTLDRLAVWMGLKPGLTMADVGCGLGYLGYTYWKYFGEGGQCIGIDTSAKLLADAREAAKEWAVGGLAQFVRGDASALPLDDNTIDIAMCQALLMHLEQPDHALAEMARIVRPGGSVVCFEADNVSGQMAIPDWSLPELDVDDFLLSRKVYLLANKGRIKLGRGDNSIGRKIPRMMSDLGLVDIDIRLNDKVHFLHPPYELDIQRDTIEKLEKQLFDEERHKILKEREREEFLAGGGAEEEHDRIRAVGEKMRAQMRKQLDDGSYFACGPGTMYVIRGRKPA
jgi:ubiquinone/menaquinone biosynthesis C-methylase UbiE